ncbi:MAG: 4'-phosphopantetheinyl transferase superfamily protein [Pseudomonadota bacterium]
MEFRPTGPSDFGMVEERIDVWLRPLLSGGYDGLAPGLLHPEEIARCARMGSEMQRDKFVTGRALARTILSHALAQPPEALVFLRIGNGKLVIEGRPEVSFNLSFANGFAALALTRGARLGIDIEAEEQAFGLDTVARRFFSSEELARICGTPRAHQCRRFLEIWTLKEAFIKATGEGFFTDLENIQFAVGMSGCIAFTMPGPAAHTWSFAQFDVLPGMIAAVCVERPSLAYSRIRTRLLSESGGITTLSPERRCRSQAVQRLDTL